MSKMSQFPEDITSWLQDRIPAEQSAQWLEAGGVTDGSPRPSELTHRVPGLPILLDGRRLDDPGTIRRFTGQALHTVVDQEALEGNLLRIYTDRAEAEDHARNLRFDEPQVPGAPERGLRPEASSPPTYPQVSNETGLPPIAGGQGYPGGVPPNGGYIDLYEHVNQGGHSWRVREWERKAVADFRTLVSCIPWPFNCMDANDQVSSIDCLISGQNPFVLLAEDINLGGSWLWLWGRSIAPNLVPFGWNDRASSLLIVYF
jgi:hypothetical protein